MKKRMICLALALMLLFALAMTGCSKQTQAEQTAEPIQTAEPAEAEAEPEAAQEPGAEEESCPSYTALADYAAAVETYVTDAGYAIETTSSTTKSTLYTVQDGGEDLVLLRVYTNEAADIDHFFIKFSYSWAASDADFAFVQRLIKFCTKSAVADMTNEQYDTVCAAVGLSDNVGMIAYSTGAAEFASDVQWTLTKGIGTLKVLNTQDAGGSYELGFYILEKDDDEPNYFAFTVTPASAEPAE